MKQINYVKAIVVSLAVLVFSLPAYSQETKAVIKAGTPVWLETVSSYSAKQVAAGSAVDFRVRSDVKVNDAVVIPAGTIAKGTVANVVKPSALGRGGNLTLSISCVNAPDGTLIPISGGNASFVGEDKTGLAVVCGLFTLFGFLIHGEDAKAPAGTQIQAVVMSNTTVTL